MPLFKSLANTGIEELSSSSTDKTPAFPPTAIQLYSTKYIHFISNTVQTYLVQNEKGDVVLKNNDETNHNKGSDPISERDKRRAKLSPKDLKSLPKEYELLTYQPVCVPDESSTTTTAATNITAAAAAASSNNPNLGIWDCRFYSDPSSCTSASSSTTFLLKSSLSHYDTCTEKIIKPTFLITIDLESIEEIQPTLSDMMTSILKSMKGRKGEPGAEAKKGGGEKKSGASPSDVPQDDGMDDDFSPSLPQFGMAPNLKEGGELDKKAPSSHHLNKMNIIICAILPCYQNNDTMTYKQKQGLNLVLYHLLKYANEINCTLCFLNQDDLEKELDVNDDDNSDAGEESKKKNADRSGLIPTGLTVNDFALVVRAICLGDETLASSIYGKNSVIDNDEKEEENTKQGEEEEGKKQNVGNDMNGHSEGDYKQKQEQSSIYFPDGYDLDLINSVYLRSASCAGVWDANTDSLWAALSPSSTLSNSLMDGPLLGGKNLDKISEDEKVEGKGGDEEWLSKLAESVSAYKSSSDAKSSSRSVDGSRKSNKTRKTKDSDGTKGTRNTVTTRGSKKIGRVKKPASSSSSKRNGEDVVDASAFFKKMIGD